MSIDAGNGRYDRQIQVGVVGPAGQRSLCDSGVLIVGCGALGSAQAELLARAGIGRMLLVDRDVLELHNLQRQLLFDEQDVADRLPKAVAAERRLSRINSEIRVESAVLDVTAANVGALIDEVDLILDGTDNFETRYLLNDAAVQSEKPYVYGGVLGTEGTVMRVDPGTGPCLRCVCPDPPDGFQTPTCHTEGVLNTAVAWVAALQVTLAMRRLMHRPLADHRIYTLDIWEGRSRSVSLHRNETCICCQQRQFEYLNGRKGATATRMCGRNAVQISPPSTRTPDFDALQQQLAAHGAVRRNGFILEFSVDDVRMVVFPDGRILVMGTTDPALARTLVSRWLGN
jgi:molybdopterin-synthase adenylyltransferase